MSKNSESHAQIQSITPRVDILPGATKMIYDCHDLGYKMGFVSGSYKNQVEVILKKVGLIGLDAPIISSEYRSNERSIPGKPAPDGYFEAVRIVGVNITRSVVFEDSNAGVLAGKRSGAYVIGVKGTGQEDLSLANYQVKTLLEIERNFLEKFGV